MRYICRFSILTSVVIFNVIYSNYTMNDQISYCTSVHAYCTRGVFYRLKVCRSSLLSGRKVRWPRRMLPVGESRWVCRRDRQT